MDTDAVGDASHHDPGRRLRRRLVLAVLGVASAWFLLAGIAVLLAASDARAGRDALDAAKDQVSEHFAADAPLQELRRGRVRLERASRRLGSVPVLPLRLLPIVGRQIRSGEALTSAAGRAARVSIDALSRVDAAVKAGRRTGPQRVRLMRDIAETGAEADRLLGRLELGPDRGLLWPMAGAHDRVVHELTGLRAGLRRAAAGAGAAADLLAGRRYLLMAANNAEMRSGSGMFLTAGVLETNDGNLSLLPPQPTFELMVPPGAVELEPDIAARWGWLRPNEEWRNLGVSPRFDVTGRQAVAMWAAVRGERVDGALAMDAGALRAVLAAVGPVTVEGEVVDADNVVDRILHDQYVAYPDEASQRARRDETGAIALATVAALQDRDWDPAVLARELAGAARRRHLLAWSAHPGEQQGWVAAGIDGALDADSLLVGILNRGGNKLDRFLRVDADLELRSTRQGTSGVLRLRLHNKVPQGEPERVAGPDPHSGVGEGVYLGIVAVTLPGDARNGRVDGDDRLVVAGADGPTRVIGSVVQVARDEERTLVVRFELPPARRVIRVLPSARMPPMRWTINGEVWSEDSFHTVRW